MKVKNTNVFEKEQKFLICNSFYVVKYSNRRECPVVEL